MKELRCRQCGRPLTRGRLCPACKSLYDKSHFQRNVVAKSASASARKRALLDWYRKLKDGKACNRCGQCWPFPAMQYDHQPGHKKFMDVSKMVRLGYEKEKIQQEIAKCLLLCASCHAIITYERLKQKRS